MRSPFLTHPDDPPDDPDVVARLRHAEENLKVEEVVKVVMKVEEVVKVVIKVEESSKSSNKSV